MKAFHIRITLFVFALSLIFTSVKAQLGDFKFNPGGTDSPQKFTRSSIQFNGYTNYWHDTYRHWYRYGNLYKLSVPDVEKSILQSKVDIAEDMGLPGLIMQEGFVTSLLSSPYHELTEPTVREVENESSNSNLLIFIDPASETGKILTSKIPTEFNFPQSLNSHQYGSPDLVRIDAFYLEKDDRKLFVISSSSNEAKEKLKTLISNTKHIVENYDLHKGWFGAETLLKSVTCTEGHPLDVIGTGMNEGNSWFVFSGYMDFLANKELDDWMKEVNLPVVAEAGFWPIFGCKDYEGLQVQSMFTKESWIDYARKKEGYVFRQVWDTLADPYKYDGYIAVEGNKKHIDEEDVPFVLRTGRLENDALASMVLFLDKDQQLTHESMWSAIMDRREVGILEQGKMMGPAYYRNALQLLLLDKVFLEDYFNDHIDISTKTEGYDLQIILNNTHHKNTSGNLELVLPDGLTVEKSNSMNLSVPAYSQKVVHFTLSPSAKSMDHANPIAIHYSWNGKKKSTVAMLDLPQAISVHRLLYGHAPVVKYPVTIHNFSKKSSFPVKLEVVDADKGKVVFKQSQTCEVARGKFKDMEYDLEVPAGNYQVNVSSLGVDYTSQLGVGVPEGKPYAYAIDLNSDGVSEYRLENDSVQVTLLATGARVIEYIVKSRDDNVLFKLWPKKAIDDKRPFRYRGYYPYGGFEDFLGQGSMETHQIYDCELEQKEGDYVRVRMWTDYYGNRLQKTFTLYGNSPLLEVRFALTFKNPEANVLGPQPILELGRRHWTEDVFTVPELDGTHEYRMKPEKYYGRAFFVKEGWNAGYDTQEDITFVGAFPVDQPLFLHMWMNHPRNGDAHHYYTEFQPWTPIYQKSTMYFSYYIWGAGGPWENGVKHLRQRNLITTR